jgi:hypothetical protein
MVDCRLSQRRYVGNGVDRYGKNLTSIDLQVAKRRGRDNILRQAPLRANQPISPSIEPIGPILFIPMPSWGEPFADKPKRAYSSLYPGSSGILSYLGIHLVHSSAEAADQFTIRRGMIVLFTKVFG